jgi:rsbT co-antagonist protein RsbR
MPDDAAARRLQERRRSPGWRPCFARASSHCPDDPELSTVPQNTILPTLLSRHEGELLTGWLSEQAAGGDRTMRVLGEAEARDQSRQLIAAIRSGIAAGGSDSIEGPVWEQAREVLARVSRDGAQAGLTPGETALFVLSLKRPLFAMLRREAKGDAEQLGEDTWRATMLLDRLALYTTEVYQRTRDEIIQRQQAEMLELSTPVVKLWDGILALPLIGTLDSRRTQIVMESLLERIVETGAEIAIIDITGVPTVDTLVAQHLIKTVNAARLMGTECIVSGIRPQIAQTIVHLGVDLQGVVTKATLADAFQVALAKSGRAVAGGAR